jgi:hypothetical protein
METKGKKKRNGAATNVFKCGGLVVATEPISSLL